MDKDKIGFEYLVYLVVYYYLVLLFSEEMGCIVMIKLFEDVDLSWIMVVVNWK